MTAFNPQLKLTIHKQFSDYLSGLSVYPINIEISPSGVCDARCSWCFYAKSRGSKFINTERLVEFLHEAHKHSKAVTWTGGGEPTLHPHFDILVRECELDQGLITNGLKIPKYSPERMSWIRVSKTEQSWNKESLRVMRQCRKLGMCINYTGDENVVEEALRVAYEVEADYVQVRPALLSGGKTVDIEPPKIADKKLLITKYKFDDARVPRNYTRCVGYHFAPFLWEDGRLDVCGYMRGQDEYHIGSIFDKSYTELFSDLPRSVPVSKECQICCKNHEINKLVCDAQDIEDSNFV